MKSLKLSMKTLRSDLVSGFATGLFSIPEGMAYAKLAGVNPLYGLYSGMLFVIGAELIAGRLPGCPADFSLVLGLCSCRTGHIPLDTVYTPAVDDFSGSRFVDDFVHFQGVMEYWSTGVMVYRS